MKNLLIAAIIFSLSSCATIMNGPTSDVEITSIPSGARFTSDHSGVSGITPMTVTIDNNRKAIHYTFRMDGYETLRHTDKGRLSGWVIGNALFGGIIGIIVDVVSENAYVHHDVQAVLIPLTEISAPKEELAIVEQSRMPQEIEIRW